MAICKLQGCDLRSLQAVAVSEMSWDVLQAAKPALPNQVPTVLLFERILKTALHWFRAPAIWYGRWTPVEAR